jgi:replicative DNA helicase
MDFTEQAMKMERLLLGSILIDATRCGEAMQIVEQSDFLDVDIGELYNFVVRLYDVGLPVNDPQWLLGEISKTNTMRSIGATQIAAMIGEAVHPGNAVYYAEEIRQLSTRRKLTKIASEMLADAQAPGIKPADVASVVSKACGEILAPSASSRLCTASEAVQEAYERMTEPRTNRNDGVCTGIACIDAMAGTMLEGELIILAARPSIGKTTLAMDVMVDAAKRGRKVFFVSCEMNRLSLGNRLLSRESGVSTEEISGALLLPEQTQLIKAAKRAYRDLGMTIWEASAPTVSQILARARSHSAKHGLDLVVVDHVGLLKPSRPMSTYEAATEIAKELKSMATTLNKPVLALCQLNRTGEGEVPKLSMLRDSGAIEENADKVWFLHRDRAQTNTKFIIAKYRQGAVGETEDDLLVFDRERCSFRDVNAGFAADFQRVQYGSSF